MNKRNKKNHKRYKKKKLLRYLRNFAVICVAGIGTLFGVDYYQTGNISRTMEYVEMVSEYVDEVSDSVLIPLVDFVGQKASDLTKPAINYVEDKAGNLANAAADKIESLGGETAENIADAIRGIGSAKNVSTLTEIPEYTGEDYVTVNGNVPVFTEEEKNSQTYEYYSDLDSLGRCGYAEAKLSRELMPTEARGAIGSVKPSGWKTIKYSIIDGLYLYNRCHLIGYQLAGENANEKNLITGTRYMNVTGMLPWENLVADYIQETGDAVMYRVTPIFDGNNLVASGVQMEAESLGSDEICFNIFVFNVQPGINIDYSNGNSWMQ